MVKYLPFIIILSPDNELPMVPPGTTLNGVEADPIAIVFLAVGTAP
jgi:hypothetical protein